MLTYFDLIYKIGLKIYIYIITGHGFWILKMYKKIKNCASVIKDAFWMIDSAFDTSYDHYIYIDR